MSRNIFLNRPKDLITEIDDESSQQLINQSNAYKYNQASMEQIQQFLVDFDYINIRLNAENLSNDQITEILPNLLSNLNNLEATWALLRISFAHNFQKILGENILSLAEFLYNAYITAEYDVHVKLLRIMKNLIQDCSYKLKFEFSQRLQLEKVLFQPKIYYEHMSLALQLIDVNPNYCLPDDIIQQVYLQIFQEKSQTFKRRAVIFISNVLEKLNDSNIKRVYLLLHQYCVPSEILNKRFSTELILLADKIIHLNDVLFTQYIKINQFDLWLNRIINSSICSSTYKLIQSMCERGIDLEVSYSNLIQRIPILCQQVSFEELLYTVSWVLDIKDDYYQLVFDNLIKINQYNNESEQFLLQQLSEKLVNKGFLFDQSFLDKFSIQLNAE